jgi:putative endonuclease
MYHVYVLASEKTGRFYVGSTEDVERRLFQHNAGYPTSTRHGVPWRLVRVESCESRAAATRWEKQYKTGKGRDELRALLAQETVRVPSAPDDASAIEPAAPVGVLRKLRGL